MEPLTSIKELQNRRFGRLMSALIHLALLLLLLLPILTYPDPPPGAAGILVNLGLPDEGSGEENAPPAEATPAENSPPVPEPEPQPKEVPVPPQQPVKQPEVLTTTDPEAIALKRKEEERKAEEAREAKERAAAEAAKKAAEEKARKDAEEAQKTKDGIASLFGSGKGKTGTPGNQGDPNGDPDASKLEGISTGSGTVGGGLGDRGLVSSPRISDASQKQGTVVVRVCVDKTGKVIEAEFTQRGSTSPDPTLKRLAVENARQWRFAEGAVDKQCGTITYRFVVQ